MGNRLATASPSDINPNMVWSGMLNFQPQNYFELVHPIYLELAYTYQLVHII